MKLQSFFHLILQDKFLQIEIIQDFSFSLLIFICFFYTIFISGSQSEIKFHNYPPSLFRFNSGKGGLFGFPLQVAKKDLPLQSNKK